MARTKVLLVTDTLNWGGSERLLVDLATRLDMSRFQVEVMTTTMGGTLLVDELDRCGIPVHVFGRRCWLGLAVLPRLVRCIAEFSPDIVQTFRFTANAYGRTAAILAGVRVVISTEHNYESKEYCRLFVDWVLGARTNCAVVISNEIFSQVRVQQRIPTKRIELIDEGIDLGRFRYQPRQAFKGASPIRVGIVGRLAPQKCQADFIDAMRLVKAAGRPFVGFIVGEGPQKEALCSAVESAGLAQDVHFVGFRSDLEIFFAELDLLVVSSRWEGLPLTLLTAAACGLPFVTTRVGGIQDAFEDRVHGLLVDPARPDQIAKAVLWCMDHYSEACEMARVASIHVHGLHGLDAMVRRHEMLYDRLTK